MNDSSSEEDISRIAEKRKGSTYKYSMQNQKVALPYVEDKPPEMSNKSEVASIKKVGFIQLPILIFLMFFLLETSWARICFWPISRYVICIKNFQKKYI